jgi:hypothetical protein
MGDHTFKKPVYFITPEGQKYLKNKINDYIEKTGYVVVDSTKKTNLKQEKEAELEPIKTGSPLDMDREQALEWLAILPDFSKNSNFAVEVRKKWNIDAN